ncbi:MAG TPA: GxxExxY protein [Saprospiraceae bacterium]|nr:GxxExxY protein [Saprospiraceae bacterium]
MQENELSYLIRRAIMRVYNALGPGIFESAYEAALIHELRALNLQVDAQVPVPLVYESVSMEVGYRLDILVEKQVIIEVKSVESLLEVHHKQLLTYLKLSGLKLGILVNFNSEDINKSIFRKVNGL